MWAAVFLLVSAQLGDGGVEPQPVVAAEPADAGVVFAEPQKFQPAPAPYSVPPDASVPFGPPPPVDAGVVHAAEPATQLILRGAAEADLGLFPSGYGENGVDLISAVHPVIAFGVGEDFLIELGPTFRFRLADFLPENRSRDVGGFLRGADWDELSDFGQILQNLRIGREAGPFFLHGGPLRKKTLGLGHLVWRYNNQLNPNYHPAGAELDVRVGPVRGSLFASDVLGARLFGGEVGWDIGGTFTSDPQVKDRYELSFSLVHDADRAGQPFSPTLPAPATRTPLDVTVMHVDAHAVLLRTANLRFMLLAGLGTRANVRGDLGLLAGLTLDATVQDVGFSTRVEIRKQNGGFRHGFFGPMYELQRFADTGFTGTPIQDVVLPDGASVFGEVRVGIGSHVTFDAAAEYFFWNRLDLDGGLSIALINDWFYTTVRTTILGIAQAPRFSVTGGLRLRLFPSFYVLAESGTVFFPQPDGSLVRGVMGSLGVGVDFEKR